MNVEIGRQNIIILFWKWQGRTVKFHRLHKLEPDIYIGFSPALHLQSGSSSPCISPVVDFLKLGRGYICLQILWLLYKVFHRWKQISFWCEKREHSCISESSTLSLFSCSSPTVYSEIYTDKAALCNKKKMANISCKTRFRHLFLKACNIAYCNPFRLS